MNLAREGRRLFGVNPRTGQYRGIGGAKFWWMCLEELVLGIISTNRAFKLYINLVEVVASWESCVRVL